MAEYDYVFKYLVLGGAAVGKHTLIDQFSQNILRTDSLKNKEGLYFGQRKFNVSDAMINIQIWTVNNQSQFTKQYCERSICILFVYDITRRSTFIEIQKTLCNYENYFNQKAQFVLVANKSDLNDQNQVSISEGELFAKENGMLFFVINSKFGENVEELFYQSSLIILQKIEDKIIDPESDYGLFFGGRNQNLGNTWISNLCQT